VSPVGESIHPRSVYKGRKMGDNFRNCVRRMQATNKEWRKFRCTVRLRGFNSTLL